MNVRFETERLLIRDIEPEDMESLLKIYTQEVNMKYISTGNYKWTYEQLSEKYNRCNINYIAGIGVFAVENKDSGKIIGEAGVFDSFGKTSKLELGYILNSMYWSRGYGYEICVGLIKYCFDNIGTKSVIARMYSENMASVKLSEKCGMKKIHVGMADSNKEYFEYEIYWCPINFNINF